MIVSWLLSLVRDGSAEKEEVCERIKHSMSKCVIRVEDVELQQTKGLLSGWRWTTLLVTLTNYLQIRLAERIYERETHVNPVISKYVMGDDDQLIVRDMQSIVGITKIYEYMGLAVNPKKTFYSKDRDEFLRKVYEPGKVEGYPARILASILYNKHEPESGDTLAFKMDSSVNNWWLAILRGCDLRRTWKQMTNDLMGLCRNSKQTVERFLYSYSFLGGAGFSVLPLTVEYKATYDRKPIRPPIPKSFGLSLEQTELLAKSFDEIEYKRTEMVFKEEDFPQRSNLRVPTVGNLPSGNAHVRFVNTTISPTRYMTYDDSGRMSDDIRVQLDPRSQIIEDRLYRNASKRFYRTWCTDSFNLSLPKSQYTTPQTMVARYGYVMERVLYREVFRWKPSFKNLYSYLTAASTLTWVSSTIGTRYRS
jgi:hypothetical protein